MKLMKDKVFLDTNIIIYLYFSDEIEKANSIKALLEYDYQFIISTQVINEFVNVMSKKKKVSFEKITEAVSELNKAFDVSVVSIETINIALSIAKKNNYSFFDCLIIASALENECNRLYTEDMHNKQRIDKSLEIINPFNS